MGLHARGQPHSHMHLSPQQGTAASRCHLTCHPPLIITPALAPAVLCPSPAPRRLCGYVCAGTTVRSAYTWTVNKRFSSQAKSLALTLATGTGTATATYELTVTKSLATQVVSVAGTFPITGTGTFGTPVLTFAPAPAATPTGSVSCVPANTAPSTCTFSQSWSDNSITAAAGGTLTVTVGAATASAPYNFAGVTGGTTGNCATVTDNFVITPSGSVTGSNMQVCVRGDQDLMRSTKLVSLLTTRMFLPLYITAWSA